MNVPTNYTYFSELYSQYVQGCQEEGLDPISYAQYIQEELEEVIAEEVIIDYYQISI